MKYYLIVFLLSTSMLGAAAPKQLDDRASQREALLRQAMHLLQTAQALDAQSGAGQPALVAMPPTRAIVPGRQRLATVDGPKPACILCYKLAISDADKAGMDEGNPDKYAVIEEFTHGTVLFANQMPYLDGHCLVLPKGHVNQAVDLSRPQRHEYRDVVDCAVPMFKQIFNSKGLNVGLNDGELAGASVPGHLHTHVIPRKPEGFLNPAADTYFITKTVKDVHTLLKGPFSRLKAALADEQDPSGIDFGHVITPDDEE